MISLNLSKTSQQILSIMLQNEGRRFYVNELIRQTDQYPNSVHKSLKTLEKQGFLKSSKVGNRKLHQIVKSNKLLPEIEMILEKQGLTKKAPKDYEWVKLVNRQVSLALQIEVGISNIENAKEIIGFTIGDIWYNSVTGGVYYKKKEVMKLGEFISKRIKKDPRFSKYLVDECKKRSDDLVEYARTLPKRDLKSHKDKKLSFILKKFVDLYRNLLPFLVVPHSVERIILNEIKDGLYDYLLKLKSEDKLDEYLDLLVSPIDDYAQERNDALKIVAYIKKHGFNKKAEKQILMHTKSYRWLPLFNLEEKPLDYKYFEDEVKNVLNQVNNPLKEIENSKKLIQKRKKEIYSVLKKLKAEREFKDKVKILQAYIFLRTYRKDAISKAHYYHLSLLNEIAKRAGILKEDIKYLTYGEIILFLEKGKLLSRKEVDNRKEAWAVISIGGKQKVISGIKEIIEAMERFRIVSPTPGSQRVLKGRVACRGVVTGRVKIVRKLSELGKVEEGDVLVAKMTTPDYMMAISKAAAIVTDEGGVTCHAAIVSREYNIPCVVGTKNATSALKDNDIVEVDAEEGAIRVAESVDVDEDIKELYGKTTYKGKVKGPVRIVLDANDFSKVRQGDILVAPQTTPEYLSSLYKVKGFIVDEDSITSHAMLYARALKIPSIIGTEFARNVLTDGEVIELNATKGLIKRLE